MTKGIRGAITVEKNTSQALEEATLELLSEMFEQNNIKLSKISHIIFTTTSDLNADFTAKCARINFGWDEIAMMCYHEIDVPNSLKMCLRIMVVYNCDENFKPKFVYLKGAQKLRK